MIPVNAANDAGISSVQKLTEEKEEASAESEDTLDEVTNTTDKEFEGSLDQPIVEEPGEVEEQPSEDIKLEETEEQTDEGDNLGEAATEQPEKVNPLIYWQPQQEPGFMIHMDTGIAIVMDLIQQMAGNLLMDTGIILDRRGIVLPDGSG